MVRPSLRDPRFEAFLVAEAVNSIGSWASAVALWGFAAYRFNASPTEVSALIICWSAPPAVLGPPLGVLVDRLGARRALIVAYLLGTGAALGLAAADSLPILAVFSVLAGGARALAGPASGALPPQIVAPDALLAANSLLGGATEFGQVLGPLVASAALALGLSHGLPCRRRHLRDRDSRLGPSAGTAPRAGATRPLAARAGRRRAYRRSPEGAEADAAHRRRRVPCLRRIPGGRASVRSSRAPSPGVAVRPLRGGGGRRRHSHRARHPPLAAHPGAALDSGTVDQRLWSSASLFVGTTWVAVAYTGAFLWGVSGMVFGVVGLTAMQRVTRPKPRPRPLAEFGRGVVAETIGLAVAGPAIAILGVRPEHSPRRRCRS